MGILGTQNKLTSVDMFFTNETTYCGIPKIIFVEKNKNNYHNFTLVKDDNWISLMLNDIVLKSSVHYLCNLNYNAI